MSCSSSEETDFINTASGNYQKLYW